MAERLDILDGLDPHLLRAAVHEYGEGEVRRRVNRLLAWLNAPYALTRGDIAEIRRRLGPHRGLAYEIEEALAAIEDVMINVQPYHNVEGYVYG